MGVVQGSVSSVKVGRMAFPKEWQKILLEKYSLDVNDYLIKEAAKDKNLSYKNEIRQVYPELMEVKVLKIEAQAGYLDNLHNNLDEMVKLDTMLMPIEYDKGNYLAVEVSGDSMNDGQIDYNGRYSSLQRIAKTSLEKQATFQSVHFIIVGRWYRLQTDPKARCRIS
ncbi:MAG: hypothetical protein IPL98_11740 [Saprospiraceae bacterium]|nr:hypothetical protein [Saprospiraceae bacterium]